MYGDDYEYADSRLTGTIVRDADGYPVFVHSIGRGMMAVVSKLSDVYTAYNTDAKTLNLKPVPLGMCNFAGHAGYLTRMPMRRDWKQGLRKGNFICHGKFVAEQVPPDILGECILGKYPTFEEALKGVSREGKKSVAWCREWNIAANMQISYKQEGGVGHFKNGQIILHEDYKYLREALQEVL